MTTRTSGALQVSLVLVGSIASFFVGWNAYNSNLAIQNSQAVSGLIASVGYLKDEVKGIDDRQNGIQKVLWKIAPNLGVNPAIVSISSSTIQ